MKLLEGGRCACPELRPIPVVMNEFRFVLMVLNAQIAYYFLGGIIGGANGLYAGIQATENLTGSAKRTQ